MLDRQLDAMMTQARNAGAPDLCELPIPAARGMYRQILSASGSPPDELRVRDLRAPGAEAGATIGVRIYARPGAQRRPVVVWYHGGGYVLGDLDGYDGVCRQLCLDADAVVVAVDYRLGPEHPYPAAFDDAWAALQWLASPAGADALGAAADTKRLAVAGDSAGAVLATAVCLQARDAGGPAIAFQALAYPPAAGACDGDFPSHQQHAEGPTLTLRTMEYFNANFFGGIEPGRRQRAALLSVPSLAGLPPALLMLAALDPLRDEGYQLGCRLNDAGNEVTLVEYHGLSHGFLTLGAAVNSARRAQRQFGDGLRQALHTRT